MINNHMLRIGALFLLTVLSYGFYNAYLPITDPVESNYVLSAITMLKHNSWISPMIYDQVWYDKPPLTYWALMISYKLFGISDFYIAHTKYTYCWWQCCAYVPSCVSH